MENQTPEKNQRTLVSMDEAEKAMQQAQQEQQANSQFVTIGNHETVTLPFKNPAVIYKKTLTGTDQRTGAPYASDKFEYELRATTSDGTAKTWSVGATNKINTEIWAEFKKGNFDIPIHREGEGTSTKYSISKERKL